MIYELAIKKRIFCEINLRELKKKQKYHRLISIRIYHNRILICET